MRIEVVTIATLLATMSCATQDQDNQDNKTGGTTSAATGGSVGSAGGSSSKAGGSTGSTGGNISSTAGKGGTSLAGGTASGGIVSTGGNRTGGSGGSGGAVSSGGATGSCTDTQPPGNTDCATWKSWNNCDQQWFLDGKYCQQTCGKCGSTGAGGNRSGGNTSSGGSHSSGGNHSSGGTNSNGGNNSSGGSASSGGSVGAPGSTNPPMTGSAKSGFATRYWDCCKPSCSWRTSLPACGIDGVTRLSNSRDAKSGCEGGPAFECYTFAPWYDSATNMSYGFVAHNGVACGTCFMFQFTGEGQHGSNPGATAIRGQQMIVQTINIGGLGGNQFDLLIPGGGVGDFAAGCQKQWGGTGANTVYGGMLSDCKGDCSCMKGKCSSFFGDKPALKSGCDWFTNWFACADNPKLQYKEVSCPSQITQKSGI